MDLTLTPEQRQLKRDVRHWLVANPPPTSLPPIDTLDGVRARRDWERRLFDGGFAAVDWPVAHGGRGLDPIGAAIFYGEYVRAGAPDRLNRIGLGLCGPTLIEWGTPAQKDRWLRTILTAEDIWCQGFSEPNAGSDLAGIETTGRVEADSIVLKGQKVWTSHSRFASWMFALVKTDPAAARHRGLSLVMVALDSPGVQVRPITQMNGAADFSEVFLDEVVVPADNLVGPLNEGWTVAMTTLRHERGSGLNTADHFAQQLREVVSLIPEYRRDDPSLQDRVGTMLQEVEAYRYLSLRTLTELTQGSSPGRQSSMGKIWWTEMQTKILQFGLDMLGEAAVLSDSASDAVVNLRQRYWLSRAAHIFAGTNEIQRDVIAERALGLPKGGRNAV